MDNSSGRPAVLDQLAVALSGLCLLHCLLLPFAVAILPFLGQFSDDHLHAELLVVVLPVSVIALALGYRRHAHAGVIAWGLTGLVVLTIGGTVAHNMYGLVADRTLTIIGSLILAFTHYRNFRLSKLAMRSVPE
jgi:MFS superfamily sulfate permease-like transporter